jgi:hypothetical protein
MSSCSTWTTSEPEPFGDRSLPTATSRTTNEPCQGGDHVEGQLAAGGGGVDRLLQAAEPDAAVGQARDGVDQVPQRPAKPVQLPHHQGVAGAELVQELLEDWAVGVGAAGGLGEDPVAAGALQGVDLEVGLLVGGGDAGVAEQVTHARERCRTL